MGLARGRPPRRPRVERERARVSETREIIIAKIEIGECSDDTRKTRNYAVTGMAYGVCVTLCGASMIPSCESAF